ncbi:hypothetical protein HDU98_001771 [Podochytrium sp. JEL0797]|nr:hypothetical protein HDU98_001771 [Podochytrium sp. JEL0797]
MDTFDGLQNKIDEWIVGFQAKHDGAKPSREEIEAHPLYLKQTQVLVASCGEPAADGCVQFVRRKQRFCTKKRTLGDVDGFCGLHRAMRSTRHDGSLAKPTPTSTSSSTPLPGRKTNIAKKMKRMLNPFTVPALPASSLPVWPLVYSDASRPLWLDIGCAKGRYLLHQSQQGFCPEWNLCGVELFAPLVSAANLLVPETKTLFYVHANITHDLERLALPNLRRVSFLFPDPWSCGENAPKKNQKKRVMSPEFALRLAKLLPTGGEVYFASDWLDLALDIRACLLSTRCFDIPDSSSATTTTESERPSSHIAYPPYTPTLKTSQLSTNQIHRQSEVSSLNPEPLIDVKSQFAKPGTRSDEQIDAANESPVLWLQGIPFGGVQTERDLVCEAQWRAIYRLVLTRNEVVPEEPVAAADVSNV